MTGTTARRTTNVEPSGWEVGMLALPLRGGGSLVFSPTWHGEGTFEELEAAVGPPAVLLAPNHYHHLSMKRFRARYPSAIAVTSAGAAPRLRRLGHEGLAALEGAASSLAPGMRLVELPHTKTGETLVAFDGPEGRSWLVCDAFFRIERPTTGAMGVALRWLDTVPGLKVGRTYRWLAVTDRRRYLEALTALVREESPRTIHFSHGEPLAAPDLPDRLIEAARIGLA